MKISASIYSNKLKTIPQTIEELDLHQIDFFHIDCNDDLAVFNDIKNIQQISTTPIDLHLISANPEKYFQAIVDLKLSHVSVQLEPTSNLKIPVDLAENIGLAITNNTPIEAFDAYKDICTYVLLMTTTPGQSGGQFNKDTFNRIRQFAKLYPNKQIQVDGGVNAEVGFILRNLGVDCAVVGSYLFNQGIIGPALLSFKKEGIKSSYLVSDLMIDLNELPVLFYDKITFENVLLAIESYKLAFVLIIDNDYNLIGLISNADVRKGLIKHLDNLNNINVIEIINKNPYYANTNMSIQSLLTYIKEIKFPVQYLPILNEQQKLAGAITFTQLIKGES
jgi:ribulose-phosphate 3-epimerase